jgi:hypothetical protein
MKVTNKIHDDFFPILISIIFPIQSFKLFITSAAAVPTEKLAPRFDFIVVGNQIKRLLCAKFGAAAAGKLIIE